MKKKISTSDLFTLVVAGSGFTTAFIGLIEDFRWYFAAGLILFAIVIITEINSIKADK